MPCLTQCTSVTSRAHTTFAPRCLHIALYFDPAGSGDHWKLTTDSRLDLWERKLKESSKKLRQKAGSLVPRGLRTPKGSMLLLDDDDDDTHLSTRDKDAKRKMLSTVYRQDVEREVNRVKSVLNSKINAASAKWKSAKVVRTREKVCE